MQKCISFFKVLNTSSLIITAMRYRQHLFKICGHCSTEFHKRFETLIITVGNVGSYGSIS